MVTTPGPRTVARILTRCAAASVQRRESLAGSAPRAGAWVLVEHAGPWGPAGWSDSGADDTLVARTQARADALGARIQLVRRHGARHDVPCTRVVLARTRPDGTWMRRFEVGGPAAIDDLPLEALGSPRPPETGQPVRGPVLLVCTHGRRDACCAELGRVVAARLAAMPGVDVWETTHTGGHRFAANVVVLPDGIVYGRVELHRLEELVLAHAGGRLVPDLMRGRASTSPWGQVAEVAVRRQWGLLAGPDVVVCDVDEAGDRARATVHTPAGALVVDLDRIPTGDPRPFSCGDDVLRDPGQIRVLAISPVSSE